MLDWLIKLDQYIFQAIHLFARSDGLDFLMIWVSNKFFWIPLYLMILYYLKVHYPRKWYWWILAAILVFGTTDVIAGKVLKPYFQRLRPCHNPYFSSWIQLPDGCGGKYGFVSNHAANTMGLTLFLWKILEKNTWLQIFMVMYVSLTAYSRMYLGAHYLGDILFGWLLAFAVVKTYQVLLKKQFNHCLSGDLS